MKILCVALLAFIAIQPVSAQYWSTGGFGSVVFPGLGHAPAGPNPFGSVVFPAMPGGFGAYSSVGSASFANRLGGITTGLYPYRGGGGYRHGTSGIYAYPVYIGGGYGYGYGAGDQAPQQPAPNITVIYPPTQTPAAVAAADQGQADDTGSTFHLFRQDAADTDVPAATEASYYLIAFKDHTIYSAVAYYIDGETLHYFTAGNVHNQVSIALVDRSLTEQLNRERGINMRLAQ